MKVGSASEAAVRPKGTPLELIALLHFTRARYYRIY